MAQGDGRRAQDRRREPGGAMDGGGKQPPTTGSEVDGSRSGAVNSWPKRPTHELTGFGGCRGKPLAPAEQRQAGGGALGWWMDDIDGRIRRGKPRRTEQPDGDIP